jgi:flagellar protein FlaJ
VAKPPADMQKIWHRTYRLLGEKIAHLPFHLDGLHDSLKKSGIKVSFPAYVSMLILLPIVVFAPSFVCSFLFFMFLIPGFGLIFALPFSLLIGLGGFGLTLMIIYIYPSLKASSRKNRLDESLPFIASYMTILSSAGVMPAKIFRSLARGHLKEVRAEATEVVRDVDVLGYDIVSSLEKLSTTSPSQKFSRLIEGVIGTIRSGGNLSSYLATESAELMRMRRISLKEYLDTLGMYAETYISLLVAFPLILMVMMGSMSVLGGSIGGMNIGTLFKLITYALIPLLSIMYLIILDAVVAKD